jgi:hypothetical protein
MTPTRTTPEPNGAGPTGFCRARDIRMARRAVKEYSAAAMKPSAHTHRVTRRAARTFIAIAT